MTEAEGKLFDAFIDEDRPKPWQVSAKGNYWRRWGNKVLILFTDAEREWWSWGIIQGRKKRFSPRGYWGRAAAEEALWRALESE